MKYTINYVQTTLMSMEFEAGTLDEALQMADDCERLGKGEEHDTKYGEFCPDLNEHPELDSEETS